MSTSMLLRSLLVFVWDDKVVDDAFNCGLFLVEVALVLFDAFLTTKKHEAVAHITYVFGRNFTLAVPTWNIIVTCRVCICPLSRVGPFRLVRK